MIIRAIVLNYNTVDCTLQCVDSLLKQLSAPSHVVVVDNHSEKADFQRLQVNLPLDVTIIRNERNLGYAAGNNRACGVLNDLPNPDAYLFVNSDAIFTQPATLQALEQALVNNPKAVAISPLVHTLSNNLPVRVQIQVRRLVKPAWLVLLHSPVLRRLPGIYERYKQFIYFDLVPYKQGIYEVDTISGACFLILSSFFDAIKGFDTATFLYLEELILGEQIRRAGYLCLLHGDVIVQHEQGVSSKQSTSRERFQHFLNSEAYLLNHYYGVSSIALKSIRIQRWTEFYLKQLYRKVITHPHLS